jgi:hypothetical protein
MALVDETGLIGRDRELEQLNNALVNGSNILLLAPEGMGKTALFEMTKNLANDYHYFNMTMSDTTFSKAVKVAIQEYHQARPEQFYIHPQAIDELSQLAQRALKNTGRLEWSNLAHFFGRVDIERAIDLLLYSFHWMSKHQIEAGEETRKPIIFVRNLKRITDANVPAFSKLFTYCQIIAILDWQFANLRHMKTLQQHFQSVVELRSLATDACRQITEAWLTKNPDIPFESDKARSLFIEHIVRDSTGKPAVIEQLLNQALTEPEITKDKIREFEYKNVEYTSMYPFLMVAVAIASAFKVIGRSMDNATMVIIGALSAVLLIIMFFLRTEIDKEPK